jgi:hypothetical protein
MAGPRPHDDLREGGSFPQALLAGPGWLLAAVLLALLAGCGRSKTPEETLEAYLEALGQADLDTAFALLAPESRRRLARAEESWIARGSDPLAPDDPPPARRGETGRTLFARLCAGPGFHGVPPLPPGPRRAVVGAHVDGERALVTVQTPAGTREVSLVQDGGAWHVLLRLPP